MSEFGGHFVNYQAARTKYFDDYFYDAADAGVRQIVIPAAGLDSRAYRLAWPEGTVVFELDQPQVLEFKRDVLTRSGEAPTAERREIAVDLRDDWPAALRAERIRSIEAVGLARRRAAGLSARRRARRALHRHPRPGGAGQPCRGR